MKWIQECIQKKLEIKMKKLVNKAKSGFDKVCALAHTKVSLNGDVALLVLGAVLLTSGMTEMVLAQTGDVGDTDIEFDQSRIVAAVEFLLQMIEGALGALVMVVAGIAAIVAAAMGAYRAAVGMLVVAIGAFILRSLVSLFFGDDFEGLGDLAG